MCVECGGRVLQPGERAVLTFGVEALGTRRPAQQPAEADGTREARRGVEAAHARRSLAGALDAQVKAEMVSVFGSQQGRRGCRLNRALDAIRAGGGVVGYKDAAPLRSEGAVKFGV